MKRRLLGAFALACIFVAFTAPVAESDPGAVGADAIRAPPGGLRHRSARDKCRTWISATGMIRPDTAREFEAFAEQQQSARLDHRAQFRRRLGARRARARPRHPQARHDDHGRPAPSRLPATTAAPMRRCRRAPIANRCAPSCCSPASRRVRAERSARARPPDLARRPPRRADRGDLFGGGSRAGAARHRPARAIHRGDGRRRRLARIVAAHSAMGADARADARRIAPHAAR